MNNSIKELAQAIYRACADAQVAIEPQGGRSS